MFNNIKCQNFKQNISNIIIDSNLPPVVVYYILKDTLHEIEDLCQEAIQQEMIQMKQQQNKEQADKADQQES